MIKNASPVLFSWVEPHRCVYGAYLVSKFIFLIILQESILIEGVEIPVHLVGDAASPLKPWLMNGYSPEDQLSAEQLSSGASLTPSPPPAPWSTPRSCAWRADGGACWRRTTLTPQTCPKWWLPAVSCTTSVRSVGIASFQSGTLPWFLVPVPWGNRTWSRLMATLSALLRSSERPSQTTCSPYCSTDAMMRRMFFQEPLRDTSSTVLGWFPLCRNGLLRSVKVQDLC